MTATDDDACQPHLYPFQDEHDWEFEMGDSTMGGDVEYVHSAVQRCRDCGWRVQVSTTLATLAPA